MRFNKVDVFIVLALSFLVRLLIFYPAFIPTGDAAQFAIFVKEITMNGGLVPSTNVLYFPGSTYIYPPLLFIIVHYVNAIYSTSAASNGLTIMRELLIVAAGASSLTAAFIYASLKGRTHGLLKVVTATVMIFFTPDLYALAWGGYPYLVAELFMILLIFVLIKRDENRYSWVLFAGILYALIALTHDLTFFFFSLSFVVIILADLLKKRFKVAGLETLSFMAGASIGIYWWIPRVHFVMDAIGLEQSSGSGLLTSVSAPPTYVVPFLLFAVIILIILAVGIATSREIRPRLILDPLTLSLLSSIVFIVFIFKDATLSARIFYYAIVLFSIVVLRDLPEYVKDAKSTKRKGDKKIRKAVTTILVIFVLASVPFQAANSAASIHYYSTGDFRYDQALIKWGSSNFGNKTVVAPHIGNYIAANDGVPVIVYGDFLVGSAQISQRNAATGIITDSGGLSALQNMTKYNVGYVVVKNSLFNSTVDGKRITFGLPYYTVVYRDQYYTVEKFTGT